MDRLSKRFLSAVLLGVFLLYGQSSVCQELEAGALRLGQDVGITGEMIGERTVDWYELVLESADFIDHPCPTPPPEPHLGFLAPEEPLPSNYGSILNRYAVGIETVRPEGSNCPDQQPAASATEALEGRGFQAWEVFRDNLESYRMGLETRRQKGQITLEQYRSDLPLYYEGIFMYKHASERVTPQPTPPPPKPQPTPPPPKPRPTPPPSN